MARRNADDKFQIPTTTNHATETPTRRKSASDYFEPLPRQPQQPSQQHFSLGRSSFAPRVDQGEAMVVDAARRFLARDNPLRQGRGLTTTQRTEGGGKRAAMRRAWAGFEELLGGLQELSGLPPPFFYAFLGALLGGIATYVTYKLGVIS